MEKGKPQKTARAPDARETEPAAVSTLDGLDRMSFASRVEMLLRAAKEAGLNVAVVEGTRDTERQKWLFENQLSPHDGELRKSAHQKGTAVDIAFLDRDGAFSWSEDHDWLRLARLAEAAGLSWGGRWTVPVLSHFQMNDPFSIEALKTHHRFGGIEASCHGCGGACGSCSADIALLRGH